MPTATNGSTEIAYSATGGGHGLVLIHGTGGRAATTWGEIEPRLTPARRVIAPDLRGCGESSAAREPLELADLAADIAAVARDADLDRYDLVGFSLGASVAMQMAADEHSQVRNLILVAPPAPAPDGRTALQFRLWADLVQSDPRLFAQLWLLTGFSRRFVEQIPVAQIERAAHFPIEPATAAQARLNARLDLREVAGRIRARSLIVTCAEDAVHPPTARVGEFLKQASAVEHVQLESGHLVVLERSDELADAILGFLADGVPE